MFKAFLLVHLLLAVFAVGPLVHAATTAGRGIRKADAAATASSARVARVYAYASLLVVLAGFGLMSSKRNGTKIAEFSDTYIWLSLVLWLVAVGLVLFVIVPTLEKATDRIGKGESVLALTGNVAAAGGIVGLLFAAVIVLMVYRPGT